jgi:integrase
MGNLPIIQRKINGKLVYCLDTYLNHNGKEIRIRKVLSHNKRLAEIKYNHLLKSIYDDSFFKMREARKHDIKFSDFADEYYHKHIQFNRSKNKSLSILNHLKKYFGKRLLSEITPDDVENYRNERSTQMSNSGKKLSPATLNRDLACMKSLYNKAILWGKAIHNPVAKIKLLHEDIKTRFLTDEEKQRFLEASKKVPKAPFLFYIIMIALNTGCRLREILSLKWTDVNFIKNRICIRTENNKSKKEKSIPMNSIVKNILMNEVKIPGSEFVFINPVTNLPLTKIDKSFKHAKKLAGIDDQALTFHSLRHSFGTALVDANIQPQVIQALMGHSDIRVTMRYCHVQERQKIEAVEKVGEWVGDQGNDASLVNIRSTDKNEVQESVKISKEIIENVLNNKVK